MCIVASINSSIQRGHGAGVGCEVCGANGFLFGMGSLLGKDVFPEVGAGPVAGLGTDVWCWGAGEGCKEVCVSISFRLTNEV